MMELNKIYCGDCLSILPSFPPNSVDLVLTDPPYGKNKDFENDNLSDKELLVFLKTISTELKRIVKYNLCIDTPKDKLPLFLEAFSDFKYEYPVILYETNGMRNGKVGFNNYGLILWFTKEKRKINRYRDIIPAPLENTKKLFLHPSPKNVRHYSKIVEMFSNKEDVVLDLFMGSGTTAVACKKLKRNYVGIELNPEYCKIAEKRIREVNELF